MRLSTALAVAAVAGAAIAVPGGDPRVAAAVAVAAVALLTAHRPLARFLAGAVAGARTPGPGEDPADRFAAMSGAEFEEHVAAVARGTGLPVIMTPVTGDWGVDLIVGRRPNRIAVQCKRYSRPVGPGAVQEVVAGAPMQDCARTMVVSNQGFTPAARRLAEQHETTLVSGPELTRLGRILTTLAAG